MNNIDQFITSLKTQILNPLISLFFVLATVIFMWGVIQYVIGSQGNEAELEKGKQIMKWGIIGMAIMASSWGIVHILCSFFDACKGVFPS